LGRCLGYYESNEVTMTQLEFAKKGELTSHMRHVADVEGIDPQQLRSAIANGHIVIPANINHKNIVPIGIGKGLKTKINANIGTSSDFSSLEDELKKMAMVVEFKADTVMDLSTGGDINAIRRRLINACPIPFGNVPVYQMIKDQVSLGQTFIDMKPEAMLKTIRLQAQDGVDYMTIHCGLTRRAVDKIISQKRVAGIVSRGGSITTAWMLRNNKENPFYDYFDQILEVAKEYDVTLSLGDGLRPGALVDGSDWGQLEELLTLGELVMRSREAGVQVMVEGPGHLPINQVEMNIKLQKVVCHEAPFYVLGPILTDIAPGYDHITAAMGGAIAASAGADFLCYVTPTEHLGLPGPNDVKEGIIASRIAAHVGDIAKGVPGAIEWDRRMAQARKALDWDEQERLCIDPVRFRSVRSQRHSQSNACSMCGELCVYNVLKDYL